MAEMRRSPAEEVGSRTTAYNYKTLPPGIFLEDAALTLTGGPKPGEEAPDFELASTEGERIRLSRLRGTPVVLIFGSVT